MKRFRPVLGCDACAALPVTRIRGSVQRKLACFKWLSCNDISRVTEGFCRAVAAVRNQPGNQPEPRRRCEDWAAEIEPRDNFPLASAQPTLEVKAVIDALRRSFAHRSRR